MFCVKGIGVQNKNRDTDFLSLPTNMHIKCQSIRLYLHLQKENELQLLAWGTQNRTHFGHNTKTTGDYRKLLSMFSLIYLPYAVSCCNVASFLEMYIVT